MDTKKKQFKPQTLRALLSVLLVATVLGGVALFHFGLETVRSYSVEVNNRLKDADASDQQVRQLQELRIEIEQSGSLLTKADQLFVSSGAFQGQSLADVRNYANQVGLSIASTTFSGPDEGGYAINVRFTEPTSYQRLIQFMKLVEGNLPKMQIASVELRRAESANSDSIVVGEMKINVSVRD